MKIVIAATGASGSLYLQRLLDHLDPEKHELHLVMSAYARQVVNEELGGLNVPAGVHEYNDKSMNAPFASGSAQLDAMVIVPCSMGTLARVATGISDTAILRAADVFLKEGRKLIIVPRETPWNLIHTRNAAQVIEAGAILLPASPGFYSKPKTVEEVVDTVVWRILDQLGIDTPNAFRWQSESE